MATVTTEQYQYRIGGDDPSTQNDPNSVSWVGLAGGKFHLRFQIAETAGGNYKNITFAVFCNTTNDPSTAFQVTTNGSQNMEPVEITNSTGGADLADGTTITSSIFASAPSGCTWVDGYYIDESDQFPVLAQLISQYTELQACVTFTGYASYGTTYYFWIKESDGTALSTYTEVAQVTPEHPYTASLSTSWDIIDSYTTSAAVAWDTLTQSTKNAAWDIQTQKTQAITWKVLNQDFFESEWKVKTQTAQVAEWEVLDFVFDVEWRVQGDTVLAGSATNVTDYYYIASMLNPDTAYEWRVRAVEQATTRYPRYESAWSSWVPFTTASESTLFLKQDVSWKIKEHKDAPLAWQIKHDTSRNTSWITYNSKDLSTSWNIALEPVRASFLLLSNLGEDMIHKFTAGLGVDVNLLLSTRLSAGLNKQNKLLTSISAEPVHSQHLLLQSLAEKDDINVNLSVLTELEDVTVLKDYSVPVEVKINV